MIERMETIEDMRKRKDVAYWERQQMVAALSHMFPSFLVKHPTEDTQWQDDWRTIVVIILPMPSNDDISKSSYPIYTVPGEKNPVYGSQITWHIHDFDLPMFDHLQYQSQAGPTYPSHGYVWDEHDTEEKYRRLRDYFRARRAENDQ